QDQTFPNLRVLRGSGQFPTLPPAFAVRINPLSFTHLRQSGKCGLMASLLQRVARPVATIRRVRELGFGLSALDLLGKRYRIAPVTVVGPMMRALRIIGSPLDFLRRKLAARKIVRIAGNPFKIPEQSGYRPIKPDEFPEHQAALTLCQNILRDRANILAENPNTYGIDLLAT